MAHLDATVGLDASQALPVVRKIGIADLKDARVKGIDDFRALPTQAIFLSIIYPVGAIIVAQLTLNDLFHPFFPLAAGFALPGPVAPPTRMRALCKEARFIATVCATKDNKAWRMKWPRSSRSV
jgi:uncharacterized membrane protein